MDPNGFDTVARELSHARSRRGALAAVFGGALGLLGLAETTAKHKKHKKKHRGTVVPPPPPESPPSSLPSPPSPPPSPCQGQQDNISCNGDGRCLAGVCNARPTCAPKNTPCSTFNPAVCCSRYCFTSNPQDVEGVCYPSQREDPCYDTAGCNTGEVVLSTCVAYRCT